MTARQHSTSGLAAALGCALLLSTVPLTPGPVSAADSEMRPGTTLRVSGMDGDPLYDPPALAPAVSASGEVIAYSAADETEGGNRLIHVRDTESRMTTALLGDPISDSTAPSLDAEGRRVAYTSTYSDFGDEVPVEHTDVYVGDLSGVETEEGATTERVTGTRRDLRYQRQAACNPRPGLVAGASSCGPRLSGDGGTLVFGARQSMIAPRLSVRVSDGEGSASATYLGETGSALALVDFHDSVSSERLVVSATGPDPVRITGVRVSGDGFSVFPLDGESLPYCEDVTLDPDGESDCYLYLEYSRDGSCRIAFGLLSLDSPTPRGRTAIRLVAEDTTGCGEISPAPQRRTASARADGEGCDPPDFAFGGFVDVENPVVSFGERPMGRSVVLAREVYNWGSVPATVTLQGHGCALQLTTPPEPSDDESGPPCEDGGELQDGATCVAYLSFTPTGVGPYAASLELSFGDAGGGSASRTRLVGAGTREVVVARRDVDGDGRFNGTRDPAAQIVSTEKDGTILDGWSPSVSHHGQYVAFVSTRNGRFDGGQVLWHDAGVAATSDSPIKSFTPGRTVNVSRTGPGSTVLHDRALQPSLSGDGTRVAFTVRDSVPENESVETQVYVRDLESDQVVLASAAAGSAGPGNGGSYAPSLSADGSTIAYVSWATDLLAESVGVSGTAVYVRDLAPDFAGTGTPGNEVISLRTGDSTGSGGQAGLPAVNADGAAVGFTSPDGLIDGEVLTEDQVYLRVRFASLEVAPTAVTLPDQQVGTTGPFRDLEVTNAGPGPALISVEDSAPFVSENGCAGVPLHRGESCIVQVAFAPDELGSFEGLVSVVGVGFLWEGSVDVVELSGTALAALLGLEPTELTFPETPLGIDSEELTVTATNLGSLPMTVEADVAEVPVDPADPDGPVKPADFAAVPPGDESCVDVPAGGSCELGSVFAPNGLDLREGTLEVVGTVEGLDYTEEASLSGPTTEPTLAFTPTVSPEGRVVFVLGESFLPGLPVQLTWNTGGVAVPLVIPDDDGAFRAPMVLLKGRGPGERLLTVVMPTVENGSVEADPLLVVPGSAQPPDFVTRD